MILIPLDFILPQVDSSTIVTEDVLDNLLDDTDAESENSELFDVLEDLIQNPVDINTADINDLQRLPGFDYRKANSIIDHRNKYGLFYSTNELFSIKDLDEKTTRTILPFVMVQSFDLKSPEDNRTEISSKSFWNYSRLIIRSRIVNDLQNRKAFLNNRYEGSKLKSYNRMIYNYSENFQLGFLTEKDPGEKSFTDFTSFHLQINNFNIIQNFIAGDYVLEYGQGLALWSPFGFSKGADAIYPVKKRARYLRPYTSSLEYRFFRGASARIELGNFNITTFYSFNTFDATIDTITGEITSFNQTGYHRTVNELNRKGAVNSKLTGGVLDYSFLNNYKVGIIFYNTSFDKKLIPKSLYDIEGKNFNYTSTYYDFNFPGINLFGEISFDGTSVASINGLQFWAGNDFVYTTSVRSYPRNYKNLYGFGFSERTGKLNNEIGIYSGIRWKTFLGVVNLYYDIFKFPYKTSENSLSSEGNEFLINLISRPFTRIETRMRYKYENKEVSELINSNQNIVRRLKQIIRAEFLYDLSKSLRLKWRFEYNHFRIGEASIKESGLLMFQDIRYLIQRDFSLYGRIIFFHTDSFNSAVYEFENDLFGVIPNLAMYGKGMRWYLIVKYKPVSVMTISAKYAETFKPQEKFLSSGDNQINNNVDNRFSLQIDFRF